MFRVLASLVCILLLVEINLCTPRENCIPYDGTCNPAVTSILFSPSSISASTSPPKIIFFTNAVTTGNIGGISGADVLCNSDVSKPQIPEHTKL